MAKKNNLKKLLKVFSPDKTAVDFSEFDKEVQKLKGKLEEKIQIQTLDDVNEQLNRFKRRISLEPLQDAIARLQESLDKRQEGLILEIEERTTELTELISAKDSDNSERSSQLSQEISDLKSQLQSLEEVRKKDVETLASSMPDLNDIEERIAESILEIGTRLDSLEEWEMPELNWEKDIEKSIDALRAEILSKLNNLGGGSMNRQILINGVDPLTRYTDINLKPGSNVTITYANNNQTKRVDVTISSSGGGGGSTRSINSVSVDTTAGDTSGTDYVYLCSGTMTLTLPTAVGNTNLYTVKNVGNGIITVNTTGGETIDNDPTAIMPVKYTSIDLISDTANWNVT